MARSLCGHTLTLFPAQLRGIPSNPAMPSHFTLSVTRDVIISGQPESELIAAFPLVSRFNSLRYKRSQIYFTAQSGNAISSTLTDFCFVVSSSS